MDLLPMQGYIRQALGANAALAALVGSRIYDEPPPDPTFPYVAFGPCHGIDATIGCSDAWEVFQTLDCWSRAVGYPDCKRIVAAMCKALEDRQPSMFAVRTALFTIQLTNVIRDPDGRTSHGIVECRAIYGPL